MQDVMQYSIPRLLIAGTHSGVGKTTVTLGIIAALKRKGLTVQPFKVGPDYLDPTYHTVAAGRRCRNLDGWMTDRQYVETSFAKAARGADIAVVEGVMGMFDGSSSVGEDGSTAQMAKWLKAPVVLVADASGVARSSAAMVQGYATFDVALKPAGVLFNNLGSSSHLALLREAVETYTHIEVLGGLPREKVIELPHRHLGLVSANKELLSDEILSSLTDMVFQWVDFERLIALARSAPPLTLVCAKKPTSDARCRIAIAMDEAFHFYYADNVELLQEAGATVIHFSPLRDRALPPGVRGLYFGGGYPEMHAKELEANREMRMAIREFAHEGGPVYAECGGLMYLCEGLRTLEGECHEMVGLLPMRTRMVGGLTALRYVEVTAREGSILAEPGMVFRGHEFHYSKFEEEPVEASGVRLTYDVRGRKAEHRMREGFSIGSVLASYIHLHFGSNPALTENFVKACLHWQ